MSLNCSMGAVPGGTPAHHQIYTRGWSAAAYQDPTSSYPSKGQGSQSSHWLLSAETAASGRPPVSSVQHAVQHGLEQQGVAHPLRSYHVDLPHSMSLARMALWSNWPTMVAIDKKALGWWTTGWLAGWYRQQNNHTSSARQAAAPTHSVVTSFGMQTAGSTLRWSHTGHLISREAVKGFQLPWHDGHASARLAIFPADGTSRLCHAGRTLHACTQQA